MVWCCWSTQAARSLLNGSPEAGEVSGDFGPQLVDHTHGPIQVVHALPEDQAAEVGDFAEESFVQGRARAGVVKLLAQGSGAAGGRFLADAGLRAFNLGDQ